jgi:hypothetical protein
VEESFELQLEVEHFLPCKQEDLCSNAMAHLEDAAVVLAYIFDLVLVLAFALVFVPAVDRLDLYYIGSFEVVAHIEVDLRKSYILYLRLGSMDFLDGIEQKHS